MKDVISLLRLIPDHSNAFLNVGTAKKPVDFGQRCDQHGTYHS